LKVAVVGGGLAGLAAALDLLDAGADVTVYEARPTLGGAVQTLPAREGDPEPPPDNGQHIALGCFTEYLRFLDRVGEGSSYLRKRLALPVIDEHGMSSSITPYRLPLYRHIAERSRAKARHSATSSVATARRRSQSTVSGTSSSGRRSTSAPTRSTAAPASSPCGPRCSARA
jgi:uncharacterized protein with NAD-binding domain and iron-sulfur cluster